MKLPSISVVIPARNAAAFLLDTLQSVAEQQCDVHEVIVVDDGSTDDTGDIAREWGARVLRTSGLGNARAMNCGIAEATGELIAHFDADDLMLPDKLSTQRRVFADDTEGRIGFVCSDLRMFSHQDGSQDEKTFLEQRPEIQRRFAALPPGETLRLSPTESRSLQAREYCLDIKSLYRRQAWERLGGFDTSYRSSNDMEFVWRLSLSYDVVVVPRVLLLGRRHTSNLSSNTRQVADECARLFREMLLQVVDAEDRRVLRARMKKELYDLAWQERQEGHWLMAAGRYLRGMVA